MKKILTGTFLLVQTITFSANPPPPGLPDDPVVVPIDSLIYVLLAAGTVFGIYTISKRK
ncbi:PID-CTERM protein-sorting domain-containing protein [Flavobacterium artemisiae]|jgi:hypothetical protein|uniref:PID-CTERM protein-sorting domain-containing protein n=1 Tax=Flavobacterium artemisiae TaxID=2126556 RepID=A0ABW4HIX9_9FLAO